MRMLMSVHLPHEPFNQALRQGTAGQILGRILEATKPEAVYFTEQKGTRGVILIVDISDAAQIPSLAEPWFLSFNADCEFRIAMTPDDLQRGGLECIAEKWA